MVRAKHWGIQPSIWTSVAIGKKSVATTVEEHFGKLAKSSIHK
jgi:hypothetical protein